MSEPVVPEVSARLLGEEAGAMLEQQATTMGIVCTSCGLEMRGPGFEFISLRPTIKAGKPTMEVGRLWICGREDCAEAREEAREKSTAVRPAGGWEVLTGTPEGSREGVRWRRLSDRSSPTRWR